METLLERNSDFSDINVYCAREKSKPPLRCHKVLLLFVELNPFSTQEFLGINLYGQIVLSARCKKLGALLDDEPSRAEFFLEMEYPIVEQFIYFLYTDSTKPGLSTGIIANFEQLLSH